MTQFNPYLDATSVDDLMQRTTCVLVRTIRLGQATRCMSATEALSDNVRSLAVTVLMAAPPAWIVSSLLVMGVDEGDDDGDVEGKVGDVTLPELDLGRTAKLATVDSMMLGVMVEKAISVAQYDVARARSVLVDIGPLRQFVWVCVKHGGVTGSGLPPSVTALVAMHVCGYDTGRSQVFMSRGDIDTVVDLARRGCHHNGRSLAFVRDLLAAVDRGLDGSVPPRWP